MIAAFVYHLLLPQFLFHHLFWSSLCLFIVLCTEENYRIAAMELIQHVFCVCMPCYSKMEQCSGRAIHCSCCTYNVNAWYNCVFSVNSCLHLCEKWSVGEVKETWMRVTIYAANIRVCVTNRKVSFMSFIYTCIDWKVHIAHSPQLELTL